MCLIGVRLGTVGLPLEVMSNLHQGTRERGRERQSIVIITDLLAIHPSVTIICSDPQPSLSLSLALEATQRDATQRNATPAKPLGMLPQDSWLCPVVHG